MRLLSYVIVVICFIVSSCSTTKDYGDLNSKYHKERRLKSSYKNYEYSDYSKEIKIADSQKNSTTKRKNFSAPVYTEDSPPPRVDISNLSPNEMLTRRAILNTADNYLGIEYKSAGKTPDTGFDCSGFTAYVFNKHGYAMQGGSNDLAKLGQMKPKNELMPGDLVFFGDQERISHVGIITSNYNGILEMIHASSKNGIIKEVITNYEYWESRFLYGKDVIKGRSNVN